MWGGLAVGFLQAQAPAPTEAEDLRIVGLQSDGAAFDPNADTWRMLPPAPLSPRWGEVSVWAGDRLLVWGGADEDYLPLADGAAYLPEEDRWEPLPPAPIDGRVSAAGVWTGEELLVLGGYISHGISEDLERQSDGVAFHPATRQWRMLPPPPSPHPALFFYDPGRGLVDAIPPGWPAWQRSVTTRLITAGDTVVVLPYDPPLEGQRLSHDALTRQVRDLAGVGSPRA